MDGGTRRTHSRSRGEAACSRTWWTAGHAALQIPRCAASRTTRRWTADLAAVNPHGPEPSCPTLTKEECGNHVSSSLSPLLRPAAQLAAVNLAGAQIGPCLSMDAGDKTYIILSTLAARRSRIVGAKLHKPTNILYYQHSRKAARRPRLHLSARRPRHSRNDRS